MLFHLDFVIYRIHRQRALSSPEPTTASSIPNSPSSSTFDEIATGSGNSCLEVSQEQQQVGQPSFAEMLRNTRTPVKSANTSAKPSVTPSIQSRTHSGIVGILSNDDEDIEEAYYASPPSNNQCFGDALARALEQTKLEDSGITITCTYTSTNVLSMHIYLFESLFIGENVNTAGKKNKKQKKKKTKGTVLFATGMTCAS